jgi:hypothetical protein
MPLLIPSTQKRLEKIPYPDSKISNQEIKARTARIASEWTCDQRSEHKRLGTAKSNWLIRLINISSKNDQE